MSHRGAAFVVLYQNVSTLHVLLSPVAVAFSILALVLDFQHRGPSGGCIRERVRDASPTLYNSRAGGQYQTVSRDAFFVEKGQTSRI